jgi:PAS domain S-box-containing protein
MTGARGVPPFGASDEQVRVLLAAIVESSDDAIVSKTIDGVITSWNGGAERMLGWPAEMAIGSHITLIVPEERRAEEDEVLARIRRGERIHHFDTVRVTRDGRLIDVSLTVSPVRDAAGRIVGASKVARDVSERRRLDDYRNALLAQEQQARSAAEALIRAKDQLLATISHELRTPLNAIVGWAGLLERPELDAQARKRAIRAIVNGAAAQARIVDDLLDLSRVVTGRLRLEVGPVNLRDVVDAALDAIRPTANAKDITLAATLAEVGTMQAAGSTAAGRVEYRDERREVHVTRRAHRRRPAACRQLRGGGSHRQRRRDQPRRVAVRFPRVLAGRQLLDTYAPRAGPRPYVGEASRRTAWWPRAGRERGQRHGRHVHCGAAVAGLDGL